MPDDTAPKPLLLDAARRAERLAFFELGPEDAAALRAFGSAAAARVDQLIADFYAHLLAFPEVAAFLRAEPGRIERLKGLQRAYFLELVEGRFDERYFASRLRVGMAHEQLGVTPEWYIARSAATCAWRCGWRSPSTIRARRCGPRSRRSSRS